MELSLAARRPTFCHLALSLPAWHPILLPQHLTPHQVALVWAVQVQALAWGVQWGAHLAAAAPWVSAAAAALSARGQAAWGQVPWGQAAWGQVPWGQAAWGQVPWGQEQVAAALCWHAARQQHQAQATLLCAVLPCCSHRRCWQHCCEG